tara:strand:- start:1249 stop:1668 length:420 start_codon:yes stop_codon:yes gene_type:complete
MKIRHLLITVAIMGIAVAAASAQDQQQGPGDINVQVVTVYIQKIYPHPQGYKVIYYRSDLYPGEVYLPGRWFTNAADKGEIIFTSHPSAPYMDVYYENGEFDHVRVFARENRADPTWGALPGNEDLTDEFSVETLDIAY